MQMNVPKKNAMKALFELSEYAERGREYHGARGQSIDTYVDERVTLLADIICDYFSNPPLKFEELKVGMWVWDNKMVLYIRIAKIIGKTIYAEDFLYGFDCYGRYEENRFYRKEVQE